MKNIIKKTVLLVLSLAFIALFTIPTQAQTRYASYSTPSNTYELGIAAIKLKMLNDGYYMASDDEFTLEKGEMKYKTRTFHPGYEYVILAAPTETGVNDLDIYVETYDGTTYAKDNDNNAASIVNFSPYINRTLNVKVKNHSSMDSDYGYDCRLLIFYKSK